MSDEELEKIASIEYRLERIEQLEKENLEYKKENLEYKKKNQEYKKEIDKLKAQLKK